MNTKRFDRFETINIELYFMKSEAVELQGRSNVLGTHKTASRHRGPYNRDTNRIRLSKLPRKVINHY